MSSKSSSQKQVETFKKVARDIGCDEDEGAFDKMLKKVASAPPRRRQAPVKRNRPTAKKRPS